MYKEYTSANVTCRFEALINNLNFLTPEKFIEPVHFSLNIKRVNEGVAKLAYGNGKRILNFFSAYFLILSLTIRR